MKKQFRILAVAFVAAMMLLAIMAVPVFAASGPGSDGSGVSGSSVVADGKANNKLTTEVTIKDDRLKAEVKDGQNKIKVDVRADADKTEVKAKAEAKTGFAGFFSRLISSIFGKKQAVQAQAPAAIAAPAGAEAKPAEAPKEAAKEPAAKEPSVITTAPGITIDKTLSQGPGYPTGPLDIALPPTQLLLDKVGQVKAGEVKDRQYEVPLETIPPTTVAIPVTINGASYTASEVKVISNLKTKAGAGQHQGTIDIDIDVPLGSTLPAGHITLQYSGSAIVSGSMISSGGVFKTSKMTGVFAGLVSEGTYSMTIIESGQAFGAPATVSIITTSSV